MAYGVVLRFDGVGEEQYWAVNKALGIEDASSAWPDDLLHHAAGPVGTGWLVTEVWTSKAAQEEFMRSRLGAALAAGGVPAPSEVLETELVNQYAPA